MSEVTRILNAIEQGDPSAAGELLPLVYGELRRLAAARLAHEKPGQTLEATALVHEAYLRLVDANQAQHWNSRGHFFGAAAEAMRRILVERARAARGGSGTAASGGAWTCSTGTLRPLPMMSSSCSWTKPSPAWPRPGGRLRSWSSCASLPA
jgi:hypothetical protein